ncbi:hypothetical protein [Gemmatimonas sp.]
MTRFSTASGDAPDRALQRFQQAVKAQQQRAIDTAAVVLKTEIVRQLSTPGRGRYYAKTAQAAGVMPGPVTPADRATQRKRRARTRALNVRRQAYAKALNAGAIDIGDITKRNILTGLHRASAPGDPPAPDTGTLRRSAFIERTETGVRVGVAMAAAAALEFGTTRAGRNRKTVILPRPYMRPALAAVQSQLGSVFRTTLNVGRR